MNQELGSLSLNKIYCMDALEGLKQIPDESVDLILTDPPYNTGMSSKSQSGFNQGWTPKSTGKPRLSNFFDDNLSDWGYEKLMKDVILECMRVLKPNKPLFFFIDHRNVNKLKDWLIWGGANYKQILVWDKIIHGLNYQNYAYQYELIIFCTKGDYFPKRINHKTDIIKISRVNSDNKIDHETVKPIKLLRELIEDNSNEGDVVLDMFMGSGSVAFASKQMKRNFIGFELEEKYVKISEKRLTQEVLNF